LCDVDARHGAHRPAQRVVSGGQGGRLREQNLGRRFQPGMQRSTRNALLRPAITAFAAGILRMKSWQNYIFLEGH
jgi:hypothetical protein